MDPKEIFQTAVKIIKLDKETIKKVAENEQTLLPAVLIVAISGLLQEPLNVVIYILQDILRIPFILFRPIITVVGSFVGLAIIYVIAYLLGGRGSLLGLYKPVAYSYMLSWLSIIPFIGWIPSLWCLLVLGVSLRTVMNLTRAKAICSIVIASGVWLTCISVGVAVYLYLLGTKLE